MDPKPFEIGDTVIANWELPAVDLKAAYAYKVTARVRRPMYQGGCEVWFYALDGAKKMNVYHDFIKKAEGVVRPTASLAA